MGAFLPALCEEFRPAGGFKIRGVVITLLGGGGQVAARKSSDETEEEEIGITCSIHGRNLNCT
jgi:hypothetical protein